MAFSLERHWGNKRLVHKQIYPIDLREAVALGDLAGDDTELWTPPVNQRILLLAAVLRIRNVETTGDALDDIVNAYPAFRLKTANGNLSTTLTLSATNGDAENNVQVFGVGPLAAAGNVATTVGAAIADIAGGQSPTEAEFIEATTRINQLRVDVLALAAALSGGGGVPLPLITNDKPLLLDTITELTIEGGDTIAEITAWDAQLDLVGLLL